MSSFVRRFARLFTAPAAPRQQTRDLDALPVRDWADLPFHHPHGDRAPR